LSSRPRPGKLAKELGNIKLDRAYIGSCTGGKTSDFLEFARVLQGKHVAIDTFGVPATPEIVNDLQSAKWGEKTVGNSRCRRGADDRERRLRRLPGGRSIPLAA